MDLNDDGEGPRGPVSLPLPIAEVHHYTALSWAGGRRVGEASQGGNSDSKTTHSPLGRKEIGYYGLNWGLGELLLVKLWQKPGSRKRERLLDEYLGFFFPERIEFVTFDRFLVPFTLNAGGYAVGSRYLLPFCDRDPG